MQITAETTAWDRLVNGLTYGSFTLPVSTGFWCQCTRLDSIYARYSQRSYDVREFNRLIRIHNLISKIKREIQIYRIILKNSYLKIQIERYLFEDRNLKIHAGQLKFKYSSLQVRTFEFKYEVNSKSSSPNDEIMQLQISDYFCFSLYYMYIREIIMSKYQKIDFRTWFLPNYYKFRMLRHDESCPSFLYILLCISIHLKILIKRDSAVARRITAGRRRAVTRDSCVYVLNT